MGKRHVLQRGIRKARKSKCDQRLCVLVAELSANPLTSETRHTLLSDHDCPDEDSSIQKTATSDGIEARQSVEQEKRCTPLDRGISLRQRSRAVSPQIDQCTIPPHLQDIIQQDFWDSKTQNLPVRHGCLHEDVLSDDRLAALYLDSAGPRKNMEVVKYTRLSPDDNLKEPKFETTCLYGQAAPDLEASYQKWAAARAERNRVGSILDLGKVTSQQSKTKGGLTVAIMKHFDRPVTLPPMLHCRVNMPPPTNPRLFYEYAEAFKSWDQAMTRSMPGYANDYKKRHWFISQWDRPCYED